MKAHAMTPRPSVQCTATRKIHSEALTGGVGGGIILLTAQFPIYQTPLLLTTPAEEMTTKQDEKALCCDMHYISGGLLDGIGSACMYVCCGEVF